ncbi:MAG: YhcH/YjgK/YiaL family protein [Eubacterium sp.]
MIFGKLEDRARYAFLEEGIQKCFQYCEDEDLLHKDKGCYEIDGRDVFVNVVEYQTVPREEKPWEGHKKYIDIHVMLSGEEVIDVNFTANMKEGSYDEERDFLALDGECVCPVTCHPGDFLICYPEDGHKPGVKVDAVKGIKKAIFKVIVASV